MLGRISWTHAAVILCLACSGPGEQAPSARLEPQLPDDAGRFAPAHSQLERSAKIHGKHLAGVDSCGKCHPDVAGQWRTSGHAFASFSNPIYRTAIDGFRAEVGNSASRFCAGCHDVAPLIDGLISGQIPPDDPRSHAGITCRTCHGITEVRADGNGSYTLGARPLPIPIRDDEASIERHRKAVSREALGSKLCLACHRSFLGPETGNGQHLSGMDDFASWQNSAHAHSGVGRVDDPVPERDCIACHMAPEAASADEVAAEDGRIASHRFLGAHTWLAAMRGDRDNLARIQEFLRETLSLDIAVAISRASPQEHGIRTLPADGAPVIPGGELLFDVVVRNLDVGHHFPGGVRDAQDAWIDIEVRDARGTLIAETGQAHATDTDDREAHVFRALVADGAGEILLARQVHRFRAGVVNHTIAPRDAHVIRYALEVPEGVAQPLAISARLRHRTRNLVLQQEVCEQSKTPTGRAFAAGSERFRGVALDPCPAQPITTIADARVWVGSGWQDRARDDREVETRPRWRRLYEHGMAWTHAVQERLDEARPSLMAALGELDAAGDERPHERAKVMAMLGRLDGRQGRTDEALAWLDKAEALVPGHPALAAIRGSALMQVWRWREAVAPLRHAAETAGRNSGAWVNLAITLGSLGEDRSALDAARRGLALVPRNAALLRVQALALGALRSQGAGTALDAYDRFRRPDRAMDVRFACAARSPSCAREREPVHTHWLRLLGAAAGPAEQ